MSGNTIMYFSSVSEMSSGASHSLLKLAYLVKKAGNKVVVILPDHGDLEDRLKQEEIDYYIVKQCNWNVWIKNIRDTKDFSYYIKFPIRSLLNKIASKRINYIAKKHKVNIIHMNTLTSFVGAKVAQKKGIKLVWHIREFMDDDLGIEFCSPQKASRLISQADCLISISKGIHDKFSSMFNVENHYTIYNGISVDAYYSDREPFKNEKVHILSSGRIMPGKGQIDLLRALAILPADIKGKIKVDIIGNVEDNDYYQILLTIKEDNNLDFVTFRGYQKNPRPFFENNDILCVCSLKEAFGRITVEGMLSNMLVVGTASGGTKEILTDSQTGYLYAPGNFEQLSEILKYAVDNRRNSKKVAKAGQNFAYLHFTDKANAEEILNVYEQLTKSE